MRNSTEERQLEFEQLVRELRSGSTEAANRLVERYSSNILRAVRRELPQAIRSKLDSVDVFQSVWLSILVKRNNLADFDTPQRLVAYLTQTAKLKVLEKYRRYTRTQAYDVKREKRLSEPVETRRAAQENSPAVKHVLADHRHAVPVAALEAREAWETLLAACSERERKILTLRLEGKTYEAIASQLELSTRTIKRAMQHILLLADS